MANDVTAIILAGGKGERLRPFTDSLPKPLVPLAGEPLLGHLLRFLAQAGVTRMVVCTGYKAEAIEAWLADHADPAWDLTLVDSGDATMTDRLVDARAHVPGRALVCYGDTLANVDVPDLLRAHEAAGRPATIAVYPLHSPFGIVDLGEGDQVSGFREKPRLPYWINIGFLLCDPEVLAALPRGLDMVSFLEGLAGRGELLAYRHQGRHLTVNTEKERQQAEQEITFFTLQEG